MAQTREIIPLSFERIDEREPLSRARSFFELTYPAAGAQAPPIARKREAEYFVWI